MNDTPSVRLGGQFITTKVGRAAAIGAGHKLGRDNVLHRINTRVWSRPNRQLAFRLHSDHISASVFKTGDPRVCSNVIY